MYNIQQVKILFSREAVCFDGCDGVPAYRVKELFGEAAMRHGIVRGANVRDYSGSYGIGDYDCDYLTYKGFVRAVTYVNCEEARMKERVSAGGAA